MSTPRGTRRDDLLAVGTIVGLTTLTALGSRLSSDYDSAWFRALRKPRWEPSGRLIGGVWTAIYASTAGAALLLWRERTRHDLRRLAALFALQFLLNYLFTPLLTRRRSLWLSLADTAALHVVVDALVVLAWPIQRAAALLLLPYSAWTLFTTALSWRVRRLN